MRYSIITGEAAFEHLHGVSFYTFMSRHQQVGEYFNSWMTRARSLLNATRRLNRKRDGQTGNPNKIRLISFT